MTQDAACHGLEHTHSPTVGAVVRRLREAAGITREELALQAGTDADWIERLEAEEVDPALSMLTSVAQALGFAVDIAFQPIPEIHRLDEIPTFANECEEDAFWSTHTIGEQLFDSPRR